MVMLIIVGILFLIVFLIWFICFKYKLKFKRMYYESMHMTKNLGFIIWITGKIRTGKTIFMFFLSHIYTFSFMNDLEKKMYEIELKLVDFPFEKYKSEFLRLRIDNSYEQVVNFLCHNTQKIDNLGAVKSKYNLDCFYFNYLKYEGNIELLKKYFECFENLNRDNYVYANILMWNQIKRTYSYNFKNEWFHVKDNKDFPFSKYMILCYDEKLLEDDNSNSVSKLNADYGSSIPLRLLGNGFEETVVYMATLQDITRLVSFEREIASCYINIEKSYIVGNFPIILKLLEKCKGVVEIFYRIKLFFTKDKISYKDKKNLFRKLLYKLQKRQEKIISNSYIMFKVAIYSKIENVGKKITEDMNDLGNYYYDFVAPIYYCYDIGNSHFFKPLFDYLIERSTIKRDDLKMTEIDLDYIEKILKKFKDNKNSNEVVSSEIKTFFK